MSPVIRQRGRGAIPRRLVGIALALVVSGCTWSAWVPGSSSWNPDVVVDPSRLAQPLALATTYVDKLGCYANVCDKRFRVIVERAGTLTVRGLFELASGDQQARMVLESPSKILGQANSGRGPRTDASPLIVRASVGKGTYFVLIQAIGGGAPTPYELTATLSREDATAAALATVTPEPENLALTEITAAANATQPAVTVDPGVPAPPPPKLIKMDRGAAGSVGYDPGVALTGSDTFAFPAVVMEDGQVAPGQALPSPEDRQLRRFIAENLTQKGFQQAQGGAPPDLLVDFSTGDTSRSLIYIPLLSDNYGLGPGYVANLRGRLEIGIVDQRINRIAWHGWTSYAEGPGNTLPEEVAPEVRRAVTEVLTGFPPAIEELPRVSTP